MVVNIENNIKASSKFWRRDDPKLFNPRNKKEGEKPIVVWKLDEDTMGKFLSLLKKMNPPTYQENKPNNTEKAPFNNNFNR